MGDKHNTESECDHVWATFSNGDATPGKNDFQYNSNEQTICLRCGAERGK